MSEVLARLRDERQRVWHLLKSMVDQAAEENRTLTADEQTVYERFNETLDKLDARIGEVHTANKRATDADAAFEATMRTARTGGPVEADRDRLNAEFRQVILENGRKPIDVLPTQRRSGFRPGIEFRTLLTTSGGGLTPTSVWDQILRHAVDNSAILKAGATVLQSDSGEPIKIPKSTAFSSAAIVTEGGTIASSDPTLGSVTLTGFKYAFLTQVSRELVEDTTFDVVGFLAEQAGIAIGNGFGAHAITGTGSGQPRGLTIDTTLGVTGGTGVAGAFTADNLIDLYHSVAEPYGRSASAAWLMRNATLGAVRKLKDSQGRYLFDINAPEGSGASGTLLGRPVYADPNVAAVALSAKSVVFGDLSKYWVRQVNGLRFERSDDFAFSTDLSTFRCLARLDGSLIDTTGAVKHFAGGAT